MFSYKVGNIIQADCQAIINTVNTVGIMGKGIALAFKKSFPANYKAYRKAFEQDELSIGIMFVHETGQITPQLIINFPTKTHWRQRSKLEYIEQGLDDLVKVIVKYNIKSIAIPPLGCGNGGLQWSVVRPLIEDKLKTISDTVDILIFEPGFADQTVRSTKAVTSLTPIRAIYLTLLRQYELLGEELSTLAVQKLAYLLQRSGENLQLKFDKGIYGPYAPNLNKMIEAFKPHYIHYGGDLSKPHTHLKLNQEKVEEVKHYVTTQLTEDQSGRLVKMTSFIEGFESAFGLELLATVAFALRECPECSVEEIISDIHNWTERKRDLMTPHLISVSYDRVKEFL